MDYASLAITWRASAIVQCCMGFWTRRFSKNFVRSTLYWPLTVRFNDISYSAVFKNLHGTGFIKSGWQRWRDELYSTPPQVFFRPVSRCAVEKTSPNVNTTMVKLSKSKQLIKKFQKFRDYEEYSIIVFSLDFTSALWMFLRMVSAVTACLWGPNSGSYNESLASLQNSWRPRLIYYSAFSSYLCTSLSPELFPDKSHSLTSFHLNFMERQDVSTKKIIWRIKTNKILVAWM